MTKTRIAPTPSGFLHAGNAFNFLVTDKLAKATGSRLVLRIDDLDAGRTRPEYIEDVFHSLEWLGIRVDEGPSGPDDFHSNWSQHLRMPRYRYVAEALRSHDALYPCLCSRTQLETLSRADHTCRTQPITEVPSGTPWRLRIPEPCPVPISELDGTTEQHDLAALMPDPVILQRDTERPAYQIASLCDDLDMGITFIVRGVDLLPSTACQAYVARLLGQDAFATIRFHHHPLALGSDGLKLSKSAGSSSLKAMRESGTSPDALIASAHRYAEALLMGITP